MVINDDPIVVRLYFLWHEMLGLYDELTHASAALTISGEKTEQKGFWLFGGKPCFLTTNTVDVAGSAEKRISVNANDYDPIQKIDDSSYWEDPLFPIIGDNSPVFIDAYELLKSTQNPPDPDVKPKFLCVDLRTKSIRPWIMFSEKEGRVLYLKP